jgi:hypothetical protein
MARRRRTAAGIESLEDLARKSAILEEELALQRQALEKLKQMGLTHAKHVSEIVSPVVRKSA